MITDKEKVINLLHNGWTMRLTMPFARTDDHKMICRLRSPNNNDVEIVSTELVALMREDKEIEFIENEWNVECVLTKEYE